MKRTLKAIAALTLAASFTAQAAMLEGQAANLGYSGTSYTSGIGYDPDEMAITVPINSDVKIGERMIVCTVGRAEKTCVKVTVLGFILNPKGDRIINATPAVFDRLGVPLDAGVFNATAVSVDDAK